jgi:E3 ubiquitin-protein ligase UBR7
MEEDESMIACLSCEDWFHEGCLVSSDTLLSILFWVSRHCDILQNLYDPSKPPPVQADDDDDESTPNPPEPAANGTMAITPKREENPIILPPDKYAHLVCGECVKKSVLLKRMAGTPGWLMVVPKENAGSQTSWSDQWEVLGQPVEKAGIITVESESDANIGEKRKAGDIAGEIDSKKARLDSEGYIASTVNLVDNRCLLPTPVSRVQAIWQSESDSRAKGDVFLVEGEREKLKALLACGCTDCTGMQQSGLPVPFPLSEEDEGEVYEPPQENASEAPSRKQFLRHVGGQRTPIDQFDDLQNLLTR